MPHGLLLVLLLCFCLAKAQAAEQWLYLFFPADNDVQQSFVRINNRSDEAGILTITGIDDEGVRSPNTVTLSFAAGQSRNFNSDDLENGNSSRGLTGALGEGTGNWRIKVTSSQTAKVLSLLEDPDGNISNLSTAIVPENDQYLINYMLPDDASQQGFIRFISNSNSATTVSIEGIDEEGSSSNITLALGANEGRHLN